MTNREWTNFIFQMSRLRAKCHDEWRTLDKWQTLDDEATEAACPLNDMHAECSEWIAKNPSDFQPGEVAEVMEWANLTWKYLLRGKFNGYVEHSTLY